MAIESNFLMVRVDVRQIDVQSVQSHDQGLMLIAFKSFEPIGKTRQSILGTLQPSVR